MKIRNGFVSNSSSSSFLLNKNALSVSQLYDLRNHISAGQRYKLPTMEYASEGDAWNIRETENEIFLSTIIDNFRMEELIKKIGADDAVIEHGDDYV